MDSEQEFEELFEREQPAMLRLAALLVGRRDVAEDVVQEAFLAVSVRWAALERPGAYLRTCVVNGCRMFHRRQRTERRKGTPQVELSAELPTEVVELHEALMTLPGRNRAALVLRYFADQPDEEIAQVLGCSRATVRSLVARGLRALRKELS